MATHSSIFAWNISMERGAWWAIVLGVIKSWTQLKQLSTAHFKLQLHGLNPTAMNYQKEKEKKKKGQQVCLEQTI